VAIFLPTFRKDLEISPHVIEGGGFRYVVKEPHSHEIFEFGDKEYFLCQQLDGQTPLADIPARFQQQFNVPLKIAELEAFVRHLQSLGLLVGETESSLVSSLPSVSSKKIRLADPDKFLQFLSSSCRCCFSPAFLVAAGLGFFLAVGICINFSSIFRAEARQYLWNPGPFFLETFIGLLVVNFVGEIGKAITCKRYGGQVQEFSLILAYRIIPHFIFETTEALWRMSKSQRLRFFSAGLISQVVLWIVAVIAWKNTRLESSAHIFWMIICVAAFFFFFFNLIPLWRRDGYFILCLWLDTPNLWDRSRALTQAWLTGKPRPEPLSSREICGFKWFGVLSVTFNILIWVLLLALLAYLLIWQWQLKGLGACLFLGLLALRFEDILRRPFMRLSPSKRFFRTELGDIRVSRVILFGLLIVFIIILCIPYPFEAGGDFKLIPANQTAIRAQVPGEITKVLVEENQWVDKDQPVATFLAKDQLARVQQAKAALESAQEKLTMYYNGPKPEDVAKAEQELRLAARTFRYSDIEAKRSDKMFAEKAVSDQDHQTALKTRDQDLEKLRVAEKNLDAVKHWPRPEEVKIQEADIRRLQADLNLAERDLQLTTLVSPVAGRIITPHPNQSIRQYLEVGDVFAFVEDSRKILAQIEVPEEDVGGVKIGAAVKLKTWAYPTKTFAGEVTAIAPVGYDKSWHRVERSLSEKEFRTGQKEILKDQGKVIRVLSECPNPKGMLKTDMTGYAKIRGGWEPVGFAFTHWLVRFIYVEVWSWIP
jgi:putative peptide zinc metalloprotease protein